MVHRIHHYVLLESLKLPPQTRFWTQYLIRIFSDRTLLIFVFTHSIATILMSFESLSRPFIRFSCFTMSKVFQQSGNHANTARYISLKLRENIGSEKLSSWGPKLSIEPNWFHLRTICFKGSLFHWKFLFRPSVI